MSKSVLVTGANSGIGLVTVLELAGAGYDVIGSVRSAAKADLLQQAADAKGVAVRTIEMDVNDTDACKQGIEELAGMTDGGPWAVVNNAGYVQAGAVEDIDDDLVRAQLETNLVAPMRIARLVLPSMRERGEGRIVNVSSIAGRLSTPLMGWYCASKHGLEAVTDALRMEVEPDGIRVILVEPGMFGTDIWSAAQQDQFPPPTTARYAAAYARSDSLSAQSKRLPDPIWVARTIRVALSNPLPMARYLVGADAVGGVLAETLIPTAVTDYVKAVTTGLRSLPVKIPFLQ
ncbi:MAG: SDR family oxidoreductase [Frankiaceae bacterium]|nr:SDR family oxidoreductase [Frankiaceae bacterium]